MKVHIIVGSQYGSEGKGKVCDYFSNKFDADYVVRCGGPNSGHTVSQGRVVQQIPSGCLSGKRGYICAGSYIDIDILLKEIDLYNPDIIIDDRAIIINSGGEEHLKDKIGSTNTGTGNGVISRVSRTNAVFAKQIESLSKYIGRPKLNGNVIIEGTQGFGLSNIHGEWPFVTSRDTTAAGFLSEVGLSPFDVENVIMVSRTFPIRVAGNSGILKNEVDWDYVSLCAGKSVIEYTTVTKKIRRVGLFDIDMFNEASRVNKPTINVLNHTDYYHNFDRGSWIKFDYYGQDTETIYE